MSIRSTTLLLCLCLVLLSSCAFPGATAPPPGESVSAEVPVGATVITFAAPPDQHDLYQPLISAFQGDYPDLRVQLVPVAHGTPLAQLVTAADTAVIETDNLPGLDPGYLLDLTPLASSDAAFQPDAFFPLAASLLMQDEQRYALPLWLDVPTFSYNQDRWAATGLPPPSADWQWSDLIAAADQIAQTSTDDPVVYGLQDDATGMLALIGMLVAAEVDLLGRDGPPALTSPAATAVYEQFFALTERGSIHTPAHEAALPNGAAADPATRIRAGQVGVWASSLLRGADAENLPFTTGTLPMPPLPVFPGRVAAHGISVGTSQPQAAWRWLTFVNQQAGLHAAAPAGSIPARPDHAVQQPAWAAMDEVQRSAFHTWLDQPLPATLGQPAGLSALSSLVVQVQLEQVPLEQALAAIPSRLAESASAAPRAAPTVLVNTPAPLRSTTHETTITFHAFGHSDQIQEVVDAFNQTQSRVYVANQPVGSIDPSRAWTIPELVAETDLDCFAWFDPPKASDAAALLDLQPLLDADATALRSDYPDLFMQPFQHANHLAGLPYSVTFRWALVYNRQHFERAALAPPTSDWSHDAFRRAAQQLTQHADAQYGFAALRATDLNFFLRHFDAALFRVNGTTLEPTLTDPNVRQAAQWYVDLLQQATPNEQIPEYRVGDSSKDELEEQAAAGQAGMWFEYGDTNPLFGYRNTSVVDHLSVTLPPLGAGKLTADDFILTGLYIAADTQDAAGCWEWLTYLSRDPAGYAMKMRFPARRSVADSAAYQQHVPADSLAMYQAYRTALDANPATIDPTHAIDFSDPRFELFWFYQAVDRAMRGDNLDDALRRAQETTRQYLACVQGGGYSGQCTRQVDPDYAGWLLETAP